MIESGPNDLFLYQKVVVSCEQAVEILPELAFKEQDFENNLLLQTTADVVDNASLERLLQCEFISVSAVG